MHWGRIFFGKKYYNATITQKSNCSWYRKEQCKMEDCVLRFPPVSSLQEHSSNFLWGSIYQTAEFPNYPQGFQRNRIKI